MARKHSLAVKAAIDVLAGEATVDNIKQGVREVLSYYEGANNTPQVRDKLITDLSDFTQHVRDEMRRRKDAGLPDPVIKKHRPAMYGIHDLKG